MFDRYRYEGSKCHCRSYQRRLLLGIETQLRNLTTAEATAHADFWSSSWGRNQPYISSGSKAFSDVVGGLSPWAWLLKGFGGGKGDRLNPEDFVR